MTPNMRARLQPFHDAAIGRGIPADEVEHWLQLARPCTILAQDGDGPVVGRFGGPLRLPADTATPGFPFVASIDLAALPDEATDLGLPPDGSLLLFALPDVAYDSSTLGEAVYVPAGTPVAERAKTGTWLETQDEREVVERYPQGWLRGTATVSMPFVYEVPIPDPPFGEPLPGHPHSSQLGELWEQIRGEIAPWGPLQIGGYASEEVMDEQDPVAAAAWYASKAAEKGSWGTGAAVSGAAEDWVLLADWEPGITGREGSTVHWVIQRDDLAARRFDRTFTSVFWNP